MLADNWPQFFNDAQAACSGRRVVRTETAATTDGRTVFFDDQFQHKSCSRLSMALWAEDERRRYRLRDLQSAVDDVRCALVAARDHFYTGSQCPQHYAAEFRRVPRRLDCSLPNEGYKVMFVPMGADGNPSGPSEVFADGFAGTTVGLPATAVHRPVGVVEGPDGSLYFSDDKGGRIWRVVYRP